MKEFHFERKRPKADLLPPIRSVNKFFQPKKKKVVLTPRIFRDFVKRINKKEKERERQLGKMFRRNARADK